MNPDRWESAKRLFHEALERPPAERDRFVREAAGSDEGLREEVVALVAAQTRGEQLFGGIALTGAPSVLPPGTWLGPYEIQQLIGAGGMGEVYQARDSRLGRTIAIKVLPELFALDADRLARFKREAQMLAALNHPNIAAIYGLEESSGRQGLVLELVDGPTLADLIARGPIPLNDALPIARQIADALEAAHEKGIIHRDLKPANIKIAGNGAVKVLDFGLAKVWEGAPAAQLSESPTLTATHDRERMILGTPAYMSPEQARGRALDKRTDIWAFGCVLYEMLTGTRAFAADDVSGTLAHVLMTEPDWDALPASTPPSIRRLLQRCLEKDPKRRLRDIGDVGFQIDDAQKAAPSGAAAARVPKSLERLWWMAAMLVVVGLTTTLYFRRAPTPQGSPAVARLTVALPAGDRLGNLNIPAIALSRAGAQLAYVGLRDGKQQLYLRSLDGLDSKAISGTEGATSPFFSPNGQWIGFFALGKLRKVSAAGGAVEIVCDAPGPAGLGGSWEPDNSIYFGRSGFSGLWKVSASGGRPTEVTRLDRSHGEFSHRWPQVLPGGKAVLFTVWTGPGFDEHRIEVQSLQTGERRVLVRGGTTGRYVASGHLVYARADALMAVRMDLDRLEAVSDAPVLLAEQVRVGGEGANYAVSDSGQLVYVPGNVRRYERRLVWVTRNGDVEAVPLPARDYSTVALSPDGGQAAVQIEEGTAGIWIYDFPRATLTRLTSVASSSQLPAWTPDGSRVVYRGTRLGVRNLFWKPADAATEEEQLTTEENRNQTPGSWSHDGKWLAFTAGAGDTGTDIWTLSLEDNRRAQIFLETPANESGPQFSPDGRWLAYVSNESGREEIYVQPFPGPRRKWLISTEGGSQPRWSRSGRELFYRIGNKMMAVDITSGPSFVAGAPRVLFEVPLASYGNNFISYDVSPDGRFFGIQDINPDPPANHINVVLNWHEELKRLVPTK
jgi:eukaryotic-like serine/threonine-protein kinase